MAFHSTLLRSRDLRNWFESQPFVISANANRDKAVAAQASIPNSEVSADVKAKHERDMVGWTDCNVPVGDPPLSFPNIYSAPFNT